MVARRHRVVEQRAGDVDPAAYARRARAIVRSVDALTDAQARAMLALLAELRGDVAAALAAVPQEAGGWPAYRLVALRRAIDDLAAEYARRYGRRLDTAVDAAWDLGAGFAPDALAAGGLRLDLPALSRAQLDVAAQLRADLVRAVSQDFRVKASQQVVKTVAGAQSAHQAITTIGQLLAGQPARVTGQYGTITAQSERILRTETMGAFNLANQARQQQIAAEVPGLRKTWVSAHDGRTRPAHAAAARRYAPGGDPGPVLVSARFVVGGERVTGPHDPAMSAANRVNCRCVSQLWSPEWQ